MEVVKNKKYYAQFDDPYYGLKGVHVHSDTNAVPNGAEIYAFAKDGFILFASLGVFQEDSTSLNGHASIEISGLGFRMCKVGFILHGNLPDMGFATDGNEVAFTYKLPCPAGTIVRFNHTGYGSSTPFELDLVIQQEY